MHFDRMLTSTSLRQVFCTLQVTSPVSGLWLCKVAHSATAHCRLDARSFFSSSVSGAPVVVGLGSCAKGSEDNAGSTASASSRQHATALGMPRSPPGLALLPRAGCGP